MWPDSDMCFLCGGMKYIIDMYSQTMPLINVLNIYFTLVFIKPEAILKFVTFYRKKRKKFGLTFRPKQSFLEGYKWQLCVL